jgi:Flp pilus assembly protein TadD
LRSAQQVLRSQAANPDALLIEARAELVKRNAQAAEQPLKTLVTLAPRSPQVQASLGMMYTLKADNAQARAAYDRALAIDPLNADALAGMTALDIGEKKSVEARKRLDAILDKHTDSIPVLFVVARGFAAMNDYAQAEKVLMHIVELQPSNVTANMQLAQLDVAQNKPDAAIAKFQEVAKLDPKSVEAYTASGMLLVAQHKREEAKKQYEQALSIDGHTPVAANNLAWMYVEDGGNLDVALQLAQAAKQSAPDSGEIDDTLGWIYFKKGLVGQAISSLKASVDRNPDNAGFKYHLGLAYAKNGDFVEARQTLQAALKLDPKSNQADAARAALATLPSLGS